MTSHSKKQRIFMAIAAHDEAFAKKHGIDQKVAKEFFDADQAAMKRRKASVESLSSDDIETISRDVHEDARHYKAELGEIVPMPWEVCPEDMRQVVRDGVKTALSGMGPSTLHDVWVTNMTNNGWTYGPEKSDELKTHPCLKPFQELSPVDQAKDTLFYNKAVESFQRIKGASVDG